MTRLQSGGESQRGVEKVCSRVLWKVRQQRVVNMRDKEAQGLSVQGRELVECLNWLACALLFVKDAARDRGLVAWGFARRWIGRRSEGNTLNGER